MYVRSKSQIFVCFDCSSWLGLSSRFQTKDRRKTGGQTKSDHDESKEDHSFASQYVLVSGNAEGQTERQTGRQTLLSSSLYFASLQRQMQILTQDKGKTSQDYARH